MKKVHNLEARLTSDSTHTLYPTGHNGSFISNNFVRFMTECQSTAMVML